MAPWNCVRQLRAEQRILARNPKSAVGEGVNAVYIFIFDDGIDITAHDLSTVSGLAERLGLSRRGRP